jgi:hypothetical protein
MFRDELMRGRDRVSHSCGDCRGSGKIARIVDPDEPIRVLRATKPCDSVCRYEEVTCGICGGRGQVTPKDGARVPVIWSGREIGTCTVPATVRNSVLVNHRPGDYTPRAVPGGMVYDASPMLGPGDIEALVGFRWKI